MPSDRGAAARVVEIVDAAAALGVRRFRRRVHLHRDADDVVAGFEQQAGGDRGVDAAAHGCNNAFFHRSDVDRITLGRG